MSSHGLSSTIIAPSNLEWPSPKELSIGTSAGLKSLSTTPVPAQGTGGSSKGGTVLFTNKFTGRVSSTPKLQSTIEFIIEHVNDGGVAGDSADVKLQKMLGNLDGKIGLAHLGLNRCIESATTTLNNKTFETVEVRKYIDIFSQSTSAETLAMISPLSARDDYQVFDSSRLNGALRSGGDTVDAISTRGTGGRYWYEFSRVPDPAVAGGLIANAVSFKVRVAEMVMASPFQFRTPDKATPFPELTDFRLQIKLVDIVKNLLNLDPAISVMGGALSARLGECTHELLMPSYEESDVLDRPGTVLYNCPFVKEEAEFTPTRTINPGKTGEFSSPSISIPGGIPTRLVYGVELPRNQMRDGTDVSYGLPIAFAPLPSMDLTINNDGGLRKDDTEDQLYEYNVEAGSVNRYAVETGQDASLGKVNPGVSGYQFVDFSTLPLGDETVPNVDKALSTKIAVGIRNTFGIPLSLQLKVFSIRDSFMIYKDGKYDMFQPLISASQLLKSKVVYAGDTKARNSVRGGAIPVSVSSIWDAMSRFFTSPAFRGAVRSVRNNPVTREWTGDNSTLGSIARSNGWGKTGGKASKVGGKASKVGGRKSGKGLVRIGGARLSDSELDGYLMG